MKKKIIIFLIAILVCGNVYAIERQRMITSSTKSANELIRTTKSTLYAVSMISTSANGWVSVYDSKDANTSSKPKLIEIQEATQNDSKVQDLGDYGIKAHDGLYLELNGAKAILYYY